MATRFPATTHSRVVATSSGEPKVEYPFSVSTRKWQVVTQRRRKSSRIKATDSDSFLEMWKRAMERERKSAEFKRIAENIAPPEVDESPEILEKKTKEFNKILQVSPEERDRVQSMQIIDRAAAALAAAKALIEENPLPRKDDDESDKSKKQGNFLSSFIIFL